MSRRLEEGVVRVLDREGGLWGTGFFVAGGLIVTCAHVVQRAGYRPGEAVRLALHGGGSLEAVLPADGYHAAEDVAFLRPPGGGRPCYALASGREKMPVRAFGYPDVGRVQGLWGEGTLTGMVTEAGQRLWQLRSDTITAGFSGGPVWDRAGRVVGMVTAVARPDALDRLRSVAFAIPAETLRRLSPTPLPLEAPLVTDFHLSLHRNDFFTGREEELRRLEAVLCPAEGEEGRAAVVSQAVAGMGGIGKTQLAVEFAYRYHARFRGVHWFDLSDPTTLITQLADYGRQRKLRADDARELAEQVLAAWKVDGPHLLILDGFEAVEAVERLPIPFDHPNLRVLITSRRRDWPGHLSGLAVLALDEFTPEESRAFLRHYLPVERAGDAELDALAARLGHLPLALELAGRYLKATPRLSVEEYLDRLSLEHRSLRGWPRARPNPTKHDVSLRETFALSWEAVAGETVARRMFLCAGHLAPNAPIPVAWFEEGLGLDVEVCDEAWTRLVGLGLLKEAGGEAVAIHPLLAEFARILLRDEASEGEREAVVGFLAALGERASRANREVDRKADYTLHKPLLPHVRAAAGWAEAVAPEEAGLLWNELGYHLHNLADYEGARAAYERALAIWEQVLGPEHPQVATAVNNLGGVLYAIGDLARARAAYERALAIFERTLPPEHPHIRIVRENLAGLGRGDARE